MTKRLTEASVSALQPDPKHTRDIPDGGARGLYVILHPSGSRTWALRYRFNGRQVKHTLGYWPKLSLAAARKAAADAHHQIERGIDPAAAKRRGDKLSRTVARWLVGLCGAEAAHVHARGSYLDKPFAWRRSVREAVTIVARPFLSPLYP
jgi:hypothetical protein